MYIQGTLNSDSKLFCQNTSVLSHHFRSCHSSVMQSTTIFLRLVIWPQCLFSNLHSGTSSQQQFVSPKKVLETSLLNKV